MEAGKPSSSIKWLGAAIIMLIPILTVFLSLVLPKPISPIRDLLQSNPFYFAASGEFCMSSVLKIEVRPATPMIENEAIGQYTNFDFAIENTSNETIHIQKIQLSVFDTVGKLVLRKFLDGNGSAPNIHTLPIRSIDAGAELLVFNPFHTFASEIELARMQYEFTFMSDPSEIVCEVECSVAPVVYETRTPLILPLRGAFIVYDGHEFYSHHRRFDYVHPVARQIGINSNFMRYAYDFCPVDDAGVMVHNDEAFNENWLGFGAAIYASGAGRVVAVDDIMPDNRSFDEANLAANPIMLFGNHIVINHLNGEYSMFAHLKQGSAKVKTGEMVEPDQLIAQIGASGSANIPHLHYELRNGADIDGVEGLPSYFHNFTRRLGVKSLVVARGIIDTGDIVQR